MKNNRELRCKVRTIAYTINKPSQAKSATPLPYLTGSIQCLATPATNMIKDRSRINNAKLTVFIHQHKTEPYWTNLINTKEKIVYQPETNQEDINKKLIKGNPPIIIKNQPTNKPEKEEAHQVAQVQSRPKLSTWRDISLRLIPPLTWSN